MNKRFTVEESNLISIFMEEGIDLDVGGRKNVINLFSGQNFTIRCFNSGVLLDPSGKSSLRNTILFD